MGPTVGVDGCQRHGIGFDGRLLGLSCLSEPLTEQTERVVGRVGLAESVTGVIAAHIGQGLDHRVAPSSNRQAFSVSGRRIGRRP